MVRGAWRQYRRSGSKADFNKLLYTLFIVGIINSAMIAGIDYARDWVYGRKVTKDAKSWAIDIIGNAAGSVYILRDIAKSITSKIDRGPYGGYDVENIVYGVLNDASNAIYDIYTYLEEIDPEKKAEKLGRALSSTASISLMGKGLPFYGPRSLLKLASPKGRRELSSKRTVTEFTEAKAKINRYAQAYEVTSKSNPDKAEKIKAKYPILELQTYANQTSKLINSRKREIEDTTKNKDLSGKEKKDAIISLQAEIKEIVGDFLEEYDSVKAKK